MSLPKTCVIESNAAFATITTAIIIPTIFVSKILKIPLFVTIGTQITSNRKIRNLILRNEKFYSAKIDFLSSNEFMSSNWLEYTKHDYNEFSVMNTWFEFINRFIGAIAGLSTLIMFLFSFSFLKTKPGVTIMSFIVLLSMLFQAWLGKLVVDSNLSPYKITVHMLMAIVILSLIIFIYKKSDVKKN